MSKRFGVGSPRNGRDPVMQSPIKPRIKKEKRYHPYTYDAKQLRGLIAKADRAEERDQLIGYDQMNPFGKAFADHALEKAKEKALANGAKVIRRRKEK